MDPLERVARRAALDAGKLLRAAWHSSKEVEYKSEVELVTNVDRESEEIILRHLKASFPSHSIVAEESALVVGRGNWLWYVDPLDGTTNFAHNFPHFAVSIAASQGGDIRFGLVYDPLREELFVAHRGGGAFLNDKPVRISPTTLLNESLLATGFPYDRRAKADFYLAFFRAFVAASQGVRRTGSAALDLCYLACGRLDGFWEWKLHPWDTAAGALIVREAGGQVTDFTGGKFDPRGEQTLASNGSIHGEMISILATVVKSVTVGS